MISSIQKLPIGLSLSHSILVGIITLSTSFGAHANWEDGGKNVYYFDFTNADRVLFQNQVRPGEVGFVESWYSPNKDRDAIYKPSSRTPEDYLPGEDYEIAGHNWSHRWADPAANQNIQTNIASSEVAVNCSAGANNCAQAVFSVTAEKCKEIKIGTSVGPVYQGISLISVSGSAAWKTCSGTSSGVLCPAANGLSFNNATYATVETSGAWGLARLTPADGKIYKTASSGSYIRAWKATCERIGGKYSRRLSFPSILDTRMTCSNITDKVSFVDYGHYPSLFTPKIAQCRIIRR